MMKPHFTKCGLLLIKEVIAVANINKSKTLYLRSTDIIIQKRINERR